MLPLNDLDALFGLFMVFVRCSAALMSSPLFGAQNTPVNVRILTSLAISFAISLVVKAHIGHTPPNLGAMILAVINEAASGLLIGMLLQLVIHPHFASRASTRVPRRRTSTILRACRAQRPPALSPRSSGSPARRPTSACPGSCWRSSSPRSPVH